MKEINILEIENIKIGNAENRNAKTGVTAIICESCAPCGVDIRGGGPASRETPLLSPLAAATGVHAVLLCGGSAFGLDAAGGAMRYLEERSIGFDTGITKVPLICASSVFDLGLGDKNVRPDFKMGYCACENAEKGIYKDGNFGVGCGATVGKLLGAEYALKSGIGSFAVQVGELKVGAVVCVNALGDIYKDGKIIAGLLTEDKKGFRSTYDAMLTSIARVDNPFVGNTTIGAVVTNGKFSKAEMNKIAQMAHNGLVRCISPVNTTADGDSLYALSVGDVNADLNVTGTVAARAVEQAIFNAVLHAEADGGLPCANDILSL